MHFTTNGKRYILLQMKKDVFYYGWKKIYFTADEKGYILLRMEKDIFYYGWKKIYFTTNGKRYILLRVKNDIFYYGWKKIYFTTDEKGCVLLRMEKKYILHQKIHFITDEKGFILLWMEQGIFNYEKGCILLRIGRDEKEYILIYMECASCVRCCPWKIKNTGHFLNFENKIRIFLSCVTSGVPMGSLKKFSQSFQQFARLQLT